MLILTRKNNEAIAIGTNIVVKVLAIEGGRIKVGIDAPPEFRISREDHHYRSDNFGNTVETQVAPGSG